MKDKEVQVGFGLTLCVLFVLLIANYSFKNGAPTCKNYLTNTYLYLAFALTLLGLVSGSLPKTGGIGKTIEGGFFIWFLLLLGLVIWFAFIPAKNVFGTHLLWTALILLFSFLISPLIGLSTGDAIVQAIMITIFIFFAMTIVAIAFEDKLQGHLSQIGLILLITLISVIVFEVFAIFTGFYARNEKIRRMISYFVILIFSGFLIYDTVSIRERATLCSEKSNPPNYPKESFDLFLDIINIFVRMLGLSR